MHTYTIRLMGDCLVDVAYTVLPNGFLGAPIFPNHDVLQKAQYAQLDSYWVKELAYMYRRGFNQAIIQEGYRGAER